MRRIVFAAVAALFVAAPLAGRAATFDPNYAPALAAVDGFLYQWSQRDMTAGMALVSPDLVHTIGAAKVRAFLSGTSSPNHAAFEVGEAQKGAGGTFIFPVRLVWSLQGATAEIDTAKVRVQKTGGRWLLVSLPYGGTSSHI
jgi:hypothetical protein